MKEEWADDRIWINPKIVNLKVTEESVIKTELKL